MFSADAFVYIKNIRGRVLTVEDGIMVDGQPVVLYDQVEASSNQLWFRLLYRDGWWMFLSAGLPYMVSNVM